MAANSFKSLNGIIQRALFLYEFSFDNSHDEWLGTKDARYTAASGLLDSSNGFPSAILDENSRKGACYSPLNRIILLPKAVLTLGQSPAQSKPTEGFSCFLLY